MSLLEEIREKFDATDADKAQSLAEHCKNVLLYAGRALWSEHKGLRMGRDDSRELSVALIQIGIDLGLVEYRPTGKQSDDFWNKVWAEGSLPPLETDDRKEQL